MSERILAFKSDEPAREDRLDSLTAPGQALARPSTVSEQSRAKGHEPVDVIQAGGRAAAEGIDAELRAAHERLRFLVALSPAAVYACQPTPPYAATFISESVAGQVGWEARQFVDDPSFWGSHIHPEDAPRVFAALGDLPEKGREVNEYRFLHKDGGYRWMRDEVRLVRGTAGEPVEVVGSWTDVTPLKQGEQALREAVRNYRDLFDYDLTADYVSTCDGRLLSCNPVFARMFGFASVAEALATPLAAFYSEPGARSAFLGELDRKGRVELRESALRGRDGKVVHVLETAVGRFDDDGRLFEIRGMLLDETPGKQLEQQFQQAQKMEAVGRLAGGVAHDFNNILGVILGYGQMMLRRMAPDDLLRSRVDGIISATERAAGLTRQLLAFSRKQIIEPRVLDLNQLTQNLGKMLGRLVGEDIEVVLKPGGDLGRVKADPTQIEQVLMNLAVNARDAMPGGGRLTIETDNAEMDGEYARAHAGAVPGRYVCLAVSDTGCGMTKETQAHIFEPFFTTKGLGKGTGLGLATVYGIVKQSGGFIYAHSEPGQGAAFKIYLPRVDEAVEKRLTAPAAQFRGSETVIVVEDEASLREILRDQLESCGYHVLVAEDAARAMEAARHYEGVIHLLLTDVVMPGMNGRELALHFKAQRPEVRVVYMSGYTHEAIADRGVVESGCLLISKPFTEEALQRKLRQALEANATG